MGGPDYSGRPRPLGLTGRGARATVAGRAGVAVLASDRRVLGVGRRHPASSAEVEAAVLVAGSGSPIMTCRCL